MMMYNANSYWRNYQMFIFKLQILNKSKYQLIILILISSILPADINAQNNADSEFKTYFHKGYFLKSLSDTTGALLNFLKAANIKPKDLEINRQIALIYEHQGKYKEANKYFKIILQIDSLNSNARAHLDVNRLRLSKIYSNVQKIRSMDRVGKIESKINQAPDTNKQQSRNPRDKSGSTLLVFIILLLIVIFIVIFIYYVKKKDGEQEKVREPPSKLSIPRTDQPQKQTVTTPIPLSKPQVHLERDKFWIPKSRSITIAGYIIDSGLYYYGQGLVAVNGYNEYAVEPSLIDPSLPVDRENANLMGSTLGYYPSYSTISSQARAGYLQWLAEGRTNPNVSIGFAFLFFYGLERRILSDSKSFKLPREEIIEIINEVERLLIMFQDNGSFQFYGKKFLEIVQLLFLDESIKTDLPIEQKSLEYPLILKLMLSKFATENQPVPAEWALSWVEYEPNNYLRTPAQRCKNEFTALFAKRYNDEFGKGIILPPNGINIKIEYRPASNSFYGRTVIAEVKNRPDITTQKRLLNKIRKIAEGCVEDLDAYSRFLGRNPESHGELAGITLLPEELISKSKNQKISDIISWLDSIIKDKDTSVGDVQSLLKVVGFDEVSSITKQQALLIAQLFNKLGFGIEPDVRFRDERIEPNGMVAIFHLEKNSPQTPTPVFRAASLILRLATVVILSDNIRSKDEEEHLERHLESVLGLSKAEKIRLRAYVEWLLSSKPDLSGLKRRITELRINQRSSIAEFLIMVANADGKIDSEEVLILKKIYTFLELDTEKLYSDIHSIQTRINDDLVTVLPGALERTGYKIPQKVSVKVPETGVSQVSLQMNIIEQKLLETDQVQSLLSQIFTSDEELPLQNKIASKEDKELIMPILGLDSLHSKLVRYIITKDTWSRGTFETVCREYGLLPDGAIENINMASFDKYGDALLEEGEPLQINQEITKELLAA